MIKLTNTTTDGIVVNRDKTKIWTDNSAATIKVGDNVSEIKAEGKINSIDFIGNQDVFVKGTFETNKLTVEAPVKVTLENKAQLPTVETKQYGSQLIVPTDSTIGTLIKPVNVKPEEAVKLPAGGIPTIGTITNTSEVVRPTTPPVTPPTTGSGSNGGSSGGGGNGGGVTNPFVSQTLSVNNVVDAPNTDPLAVGMIGTTVTTSNPNVATAILKDGKITITSKGPGTAVITVKEDAPSLKEAQILVTVDSYGKITQTIKRPLEVVQEKLKATPTPATEDLVKLYDAIDIKGITPTNVANVTAAVKKAIADKGKPLTEAELKLTVDIALLPGKIKKDNPSLQQVSTPLDLIAAGPNGTVFDWTSIEKVGDHNADIELATGNVTRDGADNENDKVTLNVTATNGSISKNASIEATILASNQAFVSETFTANNEVDADNTNPLAVGMIGTSVTSNNANVATASLKDGEIIIASKGPGTAIISVKEDAPSLKEAQIIITVDANGKITHTIKRPIEVVQDKVTALPTPAAEDLVKLYEAIDIKGITPTNVEEVTAAVKKAIAEKGQPLTEEELKLTVDIALLPEKIKKDNPSLQQVSTPLDLIATGPNGTVFDWKSVTKVGNHNANIDLATGDVTRDDADNENDIVNLNVTATNGLVSKDASIETTILAAKLPSQDLVAPLIERVETVDQDSNGKLDGLKIILSEGIKDSTVNVSNFAITDGYSNLGFNTGGGEDDNEIYITFDEGAVYDTGQTPKLTYTKGTLSDLAGNVLDTTDSIESLDKANPILVAVSINDDMWSEVGDALTLTYSEKVNVDTSVLFQDRYKSFDGHQIYFPQADAMLGLGTSNNSSNVLKNKFDIVTYNQDENGAEVGSRITVPEIPSLLPSNILRIEISHSSFRSGGVQNQSTITLKDNLFIPEITDLANNQLKHIAKTIPVTKN